MGRLSVLLSVLAVVALLGARGSACSAGGSSTPSAPLSTNGATTPAFLCPTPDPDLDLFSNPHGYVCPPGAEGGFPYSWSQAETVSDYPSTQLTNIDMTVLRQLLPVLPLQRYYDPMGEEHVMWISAVNAWSGPLVFACLFGVLVDIVLDPTGAGYQKKLDASRVKYKKKHTPSKKMLRKWAKQDASASKRLARLKALDLSKGYYVSVTSLQTKLRMRSEDPDSVPTPVHVGMLDNGVGGVDPSLQKVERKGMVMGGLITCLFILIACMLLVFLANVLFFAPPPVMPESLSVKMPLASAYQRIVRSEPYASLDQATKAILDDWVVTHDNLYVVEVMGGDWGTSCIDYSVVEHMGLADRLQVIFGASAGILPERLQDTKPTTIYKLRASGSLQLQSEGCTIDGSGMACDTLYNSEAWLDALAQPVLAYG
ncbi:hypothetical protein KIPB_004368 [Kipferlia bialata]|uniref:Uncharacterized protein n=1 Tax=Kipferlia bialata TaxID=797122 RepID=A0A9K3CVL3_9EUKA|nr:hypothetical protein KIPB_004368 [Kipferlia bialata]|eukprot:g4368.t1